MAHLIYNPSKPCSIDLPRPFHPLSPPDTDNEYPSQMHAPGPSNPSQLGQDHESPINPYPTSGEHPTIPFGRRTSALSYINSASRESRERTIIRGPRWLVVVTPPPSFVKEHGHLGNTLSSGTADRLSQGILVPLLPTMGSQLNAIAREFGLPSSVGLCIYLRTQQNGLNISPRVSDETWHMLWSHLFEARSPVSPISQMPICGQIEFDIDTSKARWYDAWLMSSRKEVVDVPVGHSRRQSSHWRGESKTTIMDDAQADQSFTAGPPARGGRHAPRRLSLLDRLDAASAAAPRAVPRQLSPDSPTEDTTIFRTLSPIAQENETPRKKDVDGMVNSWRASATVTQSPLAHTGQTSLDPANLPNTMDDSSIMTAVPAVEDELNLNEYTWSISSAGPPEYDDEIDLWESTYAPSVHLDRRLAGSVLLTPTTVTSFGPPDYDLCVHEAESNYVGSVHLDRRMEGSVLMTPSIGTSYGPPSDDEYQWSPMSSRVPSPDIAQRVHDDDVSSPSVRFEFRPAFPRVVSPVSQEPPAVKKAVNQELESVPFDPAFTEVRPWGLVWPYAPKQFVFACRSQGIATAPALADAPRTWSMVWPYTSGRTVTQDDPSPSNLGYPCVRPYPAVYPFIEPYPVVLGSDLTFAQESFASLKFRVSLPKTLPLSPAPQKIALAMPVDLLAMQSSAATSMSPVVSPCTWAQVWPYTNARTASLFGRIGSENLDAAYELPELGMWKKVWPYTDLQVLEKTGSGTPQLGFPSLNIYPAVYPFFDLYPTMPHVLEVVGSYEKPGYPYFDLYPAVGRTQSTVKTVALSVAIEYPFFNLYPAVYPWNVYDLYTPVSAEESIQNYPGLSLDLPRHYPYLQLYSPVYPHNLGSIYPAETLETLVSTVTTSTAIYTFLDIYPSNDQTSLPVSSALVPGFPSLISTSSTLAPCYPSLKLYPAVYPFNLEVIYPPIGQDSSIADTSLKLSLSAIVYSHNLEFIYAPACTPITATRIVIELPVSYPEFDLYPAVYPANLLTIYPGLPPRLFDLYVSLRPGYPNVSPYRATYPFLEVYPSVIAEHVTSAKRDEGGRDSKLVLKDVKQRRFTHAELHLQVMGLALLLTPASHPTHGILRSAPPSSPNPVARPRPRSGTVSRRQSNAPSPTVPSSLPIQRRLDTQIVPPVPTRSTHSPKLSPASSTFSRISTAFPVPPSSRHSSASPASVSQAVTFASGTGSKDSKPSSSPRRTGGRSSSTDLRRSVTSMQKPVAPVAGTDLGRAKTLPSKSILRPSRNSIVLEKARAYDLSSSVSCHETSVPVASPGQPSPADTSSRRVTRLDKSKYPFL